LQDREPAALSAPHFEQRICVPKPLDTTPYITQEDAKYIQIQQFAVAQPAPG
jgi:hypothetical protein